jgi:hypothetical protein
MRPPDLPPGPPAWLPAAGHAAAHTAAWLVLIGLGRQHQALWASGLLALVLWLAARAALQHPALQHPGWRPGARWRGPAQRSGPAALALVAGCLFALPLAPDAALLLLALAWAVLDRATGCLAAAGGPPNAPPNARPNARPGAWPAAAGMACGAALGLGPLTAGAVPGWVPGALLAAALCWQRASAGGAAAASAGHGQRPPPAGLARTPARAAGNGALQAAVPAWQASLAGAGAQLAMLVMVLNLPAMLEGCRAASWPAWLVLASHGLAMLLPAALLPLQPARAAAPWCGGAALLAGGLAPLLLPGWPGLMGGAAMQSAAWALLAAPLQAHTPRPGTGADTASHRGIHADMAARQQARRGAATAGLVLLWGLAAAQAAAPALWALQGLAALVGAALLWPTGPLSGAVGGMARPAR